MKVKIDNPIYEKDFVKKTEKIITHKFKDKVDILSTVSKKIDNKRKNK